MEEHCLICQVQKPLVTFADFICIERLMCMIRYIYLILIDEAKNPFRNDSKDLVEENRIW